MKKLLKNSTLSKQEGPRRPGCPLNSFNPTCLSPGRAWQSWRTRCSRTPWRCCKYLLWVPVPFLPMSHPYILQKGYRASSPSLGHQDPQLQAPYLCCLPQVPTHLTTNPFSTLSQGPAGKDGEAGAQGPPGPAVSVPDREA